MILYRTYLFLHKRKRKKVIEFLKKGVTMRNNVMVKVNMARFSKSSVY